MPGSVDPSYAAVHAEEDRAHWWFLGFAVEPLTYFNTLLAQPIIAVRLARAALRRPGHDLDRPAPPVNRLLAACFATEARLLRFTSAPFGMSVLLVARAAGSVPR